MVEVSPSDPAAQLAIKIADLERRLAALETARNTGVTTMHEGTLIINDGAGTRRASLGDLSALTEGFDYGLALEGADGDDAVVIDGQGFHTPYLHSGFVPRRTSAGPTYDTITSSSWVSVYTATFHRMSHKGIAVDVTIAADAGTVGEVRLQGFAGTSGAASVAGALEGKSFRWLHGENLGAGPISFTVQARRVSGAGNVFVYQPGSAALVSPIICTANGI